MPFDRTNAAERGRKGGRATLERRGRDHLARLAHEGGRAIADREGSEHMSAIGYAGYLRTLEARFGGDTELMRTWLRSIARGRSRT